MLHLYFFFVPFTTIIELFTNLMLTHSHDIYIFDIIIINFLF